MYNSAKKYSNLGRRAQLYRLRTQHEQLLSEQGDLSTEEHSLTARQDGLSTGQGTLSTCEFGVPTSEDSLNEQEELESPRNQSDSSSIGINADQSSEATNEVSFATQASLSGNSDVSMLQLVEDKIEAAIINYSLIQPRVSKKSLDTLLQQMNHFFPGVKLSSKSLLKLKTIEWNSVQYEHGRYVTIPHWQSDLVEYISNHDLLEAHIQINIDGTPVFKDSTKYNLYPVLLNL